MKFLTHTTTPVVKDILKEKSPIKVCMYVREAIRTDVRVLRAASTLTEAGFSVSVLDVERQRTNLVEENIVGIHVRHIFLRGSFVASYFKLWSLISTVLSHTYSIYLLMRMKVDIYHAHDVQALPACYIAARLRRKPLIFDAHELPLAELYHTRWHRLNTLLTYFLVNVVPRCSGVITVSPLIAQEISNHYHPLSVSLIRNIPPYQSISKSDRLRHHLGLSSQVRIALYQGNLQPNRGLDNLIRAATFLEQDIIIVIMGRDFGTTKAQLESLIISEGVVDRVKILPPVPYAELLDWTASADIGLLLNPPDHSLNVQMCLPNKLFEYLMAGLPVLSSQLDAVAAILQTYGVGRIVSSLSPANISAALNAILADATAINYMHHNALKAVQQDLCWEKECLELIHLYQNILDMQRAKGSY